MALGEQVGEYLPYRPSRLIFGDAGEHPTALVESIAMGSVAAPLPTAPTATAASSRCARAIFSAMARARGRGRQIAAVVLDDWLRGRRKHVWISRNATLLEDARRDWPAIGGVGADIQPLSNWPLGRAIGMGEGVLFVPESLTHNHSH